MEIGLFPLELVLLPGERVPLHIFEPRYKELIGECLAEDRELGLLLADEDGMREVGARAAVVEVTRVHPDGRMDIVVEGREPFRVVALTRGRSFRTAEVEEVADEADPPEPGEAERALALFARLVEVAGADVDGPEPGADRLSYELAGRVELAPAVKQELLELRSERARLRRVGELLERAIEALERQRDVHERASGNGRVSPR